MDIVAQVGVDWSASAALAKRIGAQHRACSYNARCALLREHRGALSNAVVVEGWACAESPSIAFEHSWISLNRVDWSADAQLLDPTLALLRQVDRYRYYPGAFWNLQDVQLYPGNRFITHQVGGAPGWGVQSYLEAFIASHRYVYGDAEFDALYGPKIANQRHKEPHCETT